jgi:1-acyl-sn-glycerol-3-phosphate acyltransferase
MNLVINSRCVCGDGLPWINDHIIMMLPCCHLIHQKCYKNRSLCFICKNKVVTTINKNAYKNNKKYYQHCIDIISMTNHDKLMNYNYTDSILNLPPLITLISKIPFAKGVAEGKQICKEIFDFTNITIKIVGHSNINRVNGPKVFIANHSSYLDFMAIFFVLGFGFLSSSFILENPLTKTLIDVVPCLIINRQEKNQNTVEKMKEYCKEHLGLCLFPEGMISHPGTLVRFRTGAFHIGYPVVPVVITYSHNIHDTNIQNFILKLLSGNKITITIKILEPVMQPFDDAKIEGVRRNMADAGNMILSRVANKDLADKKIPG